MDYQKNARYFKTVNYKPPIVLIIIGAITFFIGIGVVSLWSSAGGGVGYSWCCPVFGLIFIAVGVVIIITSNSGKVSDSEYDSSVSSMLNGIESRALSKLGIDKEEVKEIAPISFDGYSFKGATYGKRGDDGLWRTNKYEVVYLFFSQNEVHCYTYRFDTVNQKSTEETDVYFYKDIVSCSTSSESVSFMGTTVDYEYFKLTTTGGNSLSASFKDLDNAQRSINAMRALLKIKKQG